MDNNYYDFEGLWFEIYRNVNQHNQKLNGLGLDKSQLREVATSIFIAETHKGITRPMSDELPEPEAPVIPEPVHPDQSFIKSNNSNNIASEKQTKLIKDLLNNPKVIPEEKNRIQTILNSPDYNKDAAKEILDYFFGQSKRAGNQWIKVTEGILAER